MQQLNLHPYQESGIEFLLNTPAQCNGGGGHLLDMGLGKTACALEAFRRLKEAGKVKRMLVVAPLKVIQITWPDEIRKWDRFCGLSYTVLHGPNKAEALKRDVDIYLINYEGIDWLTDQAWVAPSIICFDELSKMKSWKSKRVKALKPFLPLFKYRWGLTGTPTPNNYYDIFAQAYMLDCGHTFGKFITHFCNEYFEPLLKHEYKPKPKQDCVEGLAQKMSKLFYRLDGKDYLDLPTEIHNPIYLELPKGLHTKYTELQKEFITKMGEVTLSVTSASALSNKLRQFLSGNVYTDETEYEFIHDVKFNALKDLIEEQQGRPILVGYKYRHELFTFKKMFKDAVFLDEYPSTAEVQKVVAAWNRGEVTVMFGHPASIGFGLNLQQACNTIAITSLDFNLADYLQFIKRVSRQGQKESHVIINYLIFKNTIDEMIVKVLASKNASQLLLLDKIKEIQNV